MHYRKDISLQQKYTCRNTVQGRYLLCDDNGMYVLWLSRLSTFYSTLFLIYQYATGMNLFAILKYSESVDSN